MTASDNGVVHLADYRAPAWRVEQVELEFDLDISATRVLARLHLRRGAGAAQPLRLDGAGQELHAIRLDGRALAGGGWQGLRHHSRAHRQ